MLSLFLNEWFLYYRTCDTRYCTPLHISCILYSYDKWNTLLINEMEVVVNLDFDIKDEKTTQV